MPRSVGRVAMISMHTSPLDQPGTGDAGGMNVYVAQVAKGLAARGTTVDIFTRATCRAQAPVVELAPGVSVRHVVAGPFEELDKTELPAHLCDFISGMDGGPGFDLVHSHYWLSGQAGAVAARRWGIPLVHSMHTLAKVKNANLAEGDKPEPAGRVLGETQIVDAADVLVANTGAEAEQLVSLYCAEPGRVTTVSPGVDLTTFRPRSRRRARTRLNLPHDAHVLLFAGRIQPLKGPDILLRAAARMLDNDPSLRAKLIVAIVGGPSGCSRTRPEEMQRLAAQLGITDVVRFEPPCPQPELADWYRAADITVVPSHSESFGLVAVESQACGTPVVAAATGGLTTAVRHGESGILVNGHDPRDYAAALSELIAQPRQMRHLGANAVKHAASFSWNHTTDQLAAVYATARTQPETMIV